MIGWNLKTGKSYVAVLVRISAVAGAWRDNLLIGDLLVTDKQAIKDVMNGKVEISLGYDTDYLQLEKGRATQSNIVINHIALSRKGTTAIDVQLRIVRLWLKRQNTLVSGIT